MAAKFFWYISTSELAWKIQTGHEINCWNSNFPKTQVNYLVVIVVQTEWIQNNLTTFQPTQVKDVQQETECEAAGQSKYIQFIMSKIKFSMIC